MAAYLLIVGLAACAGRGLVGLLGPRAAPARAWLLGPPALLSAATVTLGLLVLARLPLRAAAPWLWTAAALLALAGLRRARRELRPGLFALLGVCAGLPAALLGPSFVAGLDHAGVFFGDGWAYVADAQYLWELPRPGALSPLHAWASTLTDTRHASASLLALLSPTELAGDPQRVTGLFCALLLFAYACGCASLAPGPRRRLAFLLLAVPAGWVGHVLAQSNYDQAVALALLPAAWGCFTRLQPRRGDVLLAGLQLAALAFAYAELAPVCLACGALAALWSAWRSPRARARLAAAGAALAVAAVLLAPYFTQLVRFLGWQLQRLQALPGGQPFAGLLEAGRLPAALWGLGSEQAEWHSAWPLGLRALAWLLTVLALLGAWHARRGRHAHLLALALPCGAAAAALIARGSPYGAYKLLALAYWCFALLALLGAAALAGRLAAGSEGTVRAALVAVVLLAMAASPGLRRLRSAEAPEGLDFGRLRSLAQTVTGLRPGGLGLDLRGPARQQWAAYFLRDVPLRVYEFQGYLANPSARLRLATAARPGWDAIDYLLTDTAWTPAGGPAAPERVADEAPLRLWRLRPEATWLDTRPGEPGRLELTLQLRRAGRVSLFARLPGGGPARLRAQSEGAAFERTLPESGLELELPLPAGPSLIRLTSLEPDRRPTVDPDSLRLQPGPSCGAQPGEGSGRGQLELSPRLPARRARLGATADFNADGEPDLAWQDDASSELELQLSCGGQPAVFAVTQPPGPSGPSWRLTGAGDLDGDGLPDLLFVHPRQARALAWYLDGALRRKDEALLPPPDEGGGWTALAPEPHGALPAGEIAVRWRHQGGRIVRVRCSRDGRRLAVGAEAP